MLKQHINNSSSEMDIVDKNVFLLSNITQKTCTELLIVEERVNGKQTAKLVMHSALEINEFYRTSNKK